MEICIGNAFESCKTTFLSEVFISTASMVTLSSSAQFLMLNPINGSKNIVRRVKVFHRGTGTCAHLPNNELDQFKQLQLLQFAIGVGVG